MDLGTVRSTRVERGRCVVIEETCGRVFRGIIFPNNRANGASTTTILGVVNIYEGAFGVAIGNFYGRAFLFKGGIFGVGLARGIQGFASTIIEVFVTGIWYLNFGGVGCALIQDWGYFAFFGGFGLFDRLVGGFLFFGAQWFAWLRLGGNDYLGVIGIGPFGWDLLAFKGEFAYASSFCGLIGGVGHGFWSLWGVYTFLHLALFVDDATNGGVALRIGTILGRFLRNWGFKFSIGGNGWGYARNNLWDDVFVGLVWGGLQIYVFFGIGGGSSATIALA